MIRCLCLSLSLTLAHVGTAAAATAVPSADGSPQKVMRLCRTLLGRGGEATKKQASRMLEQVPEAKRLLAEESGKKGLAVTRELAGYLCGRYYMFYLSRNQMRADAEKLLVLIRKIAKTNDKLLQIVEQDRARKLSQPGKAYLSLLAARSPNLERLVLFPSITFLPHSVSSTLLRYHSNNRRLLRSSRNIHQIAALLHVLERDRKQLLSALTNIAAQKKIPSMF
jgi:hypothetical protein